jgi:hypothetical protein
VLKGEVLIPFVTQLEGRKIRPAQGEIIDIPPNVDWVRAGFVRIIEEEALEETPAKPKRKKAEDKS